MSLKAVTHSHQRLNKEREARGKNLSWQRGDWISGESRRERNDSEEHTGTRGRFPQGKEPHSHVPRRVCPELGPSYVKVRASG